MPQPPPRKTLNEAAMNVDERQYYSGEEAASAYNFYSASQSPASVLRRGALWRGRGAACCGVLRRAVLRGGALSLISSIVTTAVVRAHGVERAAPAKEGAD